MVSEQSYPRIVTEFSTNSSKKHSRSCRAYNSSKINSNYCLLLEPSLPQKPYLNFTSAVSLRNVPLRSRKKKKKKENEVRKLGFLPSPSTGFKFSRTEQCLGLLVSEVGFPANQWLWLIGDSRIELQLVVAARSYLYLFI